MTGKISPSLLNTVNLCSADRIDVVVYVRDRRGFSGLPQFDVIREYPFLNAAGISCFPYEIEKLSRLSCVEYIQGGSKVFALDTPISANVIEGINYSTTLSGKGVTLAVLDTGIQPHLDLCAPICRIKSFYDAERNEITEPYDDNGHGTFVSGIACGNGFSSGKLLSGVAPSAEVVGVKVISADGESGVFSVLDGMQWVLDNRKKLDIKVCCMSFGSNPVDANDPLKRGAEVLVANQIAVVCAAGNSGENSVKSPAVSPKVISVGAVDDDGKIAGFSSRGFVQGRRKPEIYASGVDVMSIRAGGTYGKMSGTSAAAPYIAGACCLLLERFPSATPHRLKEMLLNGASLIDGNFVLKLSRGDSFYGL